MSAALGQPSPDEVLPRLGPVGRAALRVLRERVAAGLYPPGSKLPGERDLAESLHVSRAVLRNALAVLSAEGVLESTPWQGWFVRGRRLSERVELQSFSERARTRGMTSDSQIIERHKRRLTNDEAATFGLPGRAAAVDTLRLRRVDDMPICVDRSVIPLDRAPGFDHVSLAGATSLYERLETVCGVRVVRSDYTVRAAGAEPAIAGLLGIQTGDPVLIGEELAYDQSGAAVNLGSAVFRHDAYDFRATLFRPAVP